MVAHSGSVMTCFVIGCLCLIVVHALKSEHHAKKLEGADLQVQRIIKDALKHVTPLSFLLFVLICYVAYELCKSTSKRFKMHVLDHDGLNEALILETKLGARDFLFLIDTGYAGAPVLSRHYLAVRDPVHVNIVERYKKIMQDMSRVTEDDEHRALTDYIQTCGCLPYTSGCTMKLMGIGSTVEQQSDMLMCPMLQIKTVHDRFYAPKRDAAPHADVFVTNSLRSSIHILTSDFLLHHSPTLISISKRQMETNIPPAVFLSMMPQFVMQDSLFSGGSFVVKFSVQETEFECTLDTGAPGPICLGSQAVKKIKKCFLRESKVLKQTGVNGEDICSELIETDVKFCNQVLRVPIFVNNHPTDHVDGYMGIGFLRAFDLLFTHQQVGFKRNGLSMRNLEFYAKYAKSGTCNLILQCSKT